MPNAGYVFLACLFVVLAIILRLLWRHNTAWISKDLERLDLRVLSEVAKGRRFGVGRDRLTRLTRRGFTAKDKWGGCRVTLRGRYAAFIMRTQAASAHNTRPSDRSPA